MTPRRAAALPAPPPTARPVAYLRRSKVNPRSPGAVSHETQKQKVEAIAGEDAPLLDWVEDWGKSGRGETLHRRTAYADLCDRVAKGQVSAIYSYSLNRLGRNLSQLNDLAHLCAERGIPIRCADGFSPDVTTSTGRMILNILGAIAQYTAEWASEAAINTNAIRRERGDTLGAPRYGSREGEDVTALVAAFTEAGTFRGAIQKLNADGILSPQGHAWSITSLARILRRPEIAAASPSKAQGVRAGRATRIFSRLLYCHCGAPTPMTTMPGRHSPRYRCNRGEQDDRHPRPVTVTESQLLPWAQAEVIRGLGSHMLEIRYADQNVAVRAALEAKRARLMEAYLDMRFDKVVLDRMLTETDAELAALGQVDRAIAAVALKPAIRWDAPAGEVNERLRELWRSVQLGPDLRPLSADWYLSLEESAAAEDALTASLRET